MLEAIARGIDVDAVDAVVSYDIPARLKTYIHCVRRTARIRRAGQAVKLMLERQRSNFQRLMVQAGGRVRETLALLDELRAAPVRGDLRRWISTLASS